MNIFLNSCRKQAAEGITSSSLTLKRVGRIGGFTLVEVLVATVILSIVLAALYSTFFLSHRAIEGMDESMTKLQESRKALDILKRELEAAVYDKDKKDTQFKMLDRDLFGKPASQITFTAISTLRPGLSKLSYYVEKKDNRMTLFKKVEPVFSDKTTEGADIIEELEGVSLEAKYRDKWVKTWDTELSKELPEQIRMSLTVKIKDRNITLSDVAKIMYDRAI